MKTNKLTLQRITKGRYLDTKWSFLFVHDPSVEGTNKWCVFNLDNDELLDEFLNDCDQMYHTLYEAETAVATFVSDFYPNLFYV